MKNLIYAFTLIIVTIFISCSDDDTNLEENEPDSTFQITFDGTSYNIHSVHINDRGLNEETGYYNSSPTFLASSGDIEIELTVDLFSSQEVNNFFSEGVFTYDENAVAPLFFNNSYITILDNSNVIDIAFINGGEISFEETSLCSLFIINLSSLDNRNITGEYEGETLGPRISI